MLKRRGPNQLKSDVTNGKFKSETAKFLPVLICSRLIIISSDIIPKEVEPGVHVGISAKWVGELRGEICTRMYKFRPLTSCSARAAQRKIPRG